MGAADRERCLPGTRLDTLQDLFIALIHPNPENNIIWLRGPAGCGKSTILNTLAHYFDQLHRQGAFLFWDRNDTDSSEPHRVIHTLAHQLARFDPMFARELAKRINKWPRVTDSSLDSQFQCLLQEPLSALMTTRHFGPIVVVLDALDECGTPESRRHLLNTLSAGFAKLPKVFRVLIASRDEPDIYAALSPLKPDVRYAPMGDEPTSLDIQLLFQKRLASDASAFLSYGLPPEWPGVDVIRKLVTLSGGLFIWASTTVRFIEHGFPSERLNKVLHTSHASSHTKLDDLYRVALTHPFRSYEESEHKAVHSILGAILVAREQLTEEQLSQLLGLAIDTVRNVLLRLQPLLQGGRGQPVWVLHTSFIDFLCDIGRCQDPKWHVITSVHHLDLASRCLRIMEQNLKFNICGIETSYYSNNELEGIQERVDQAITPALMYACQHWASHLESGTAQKEGSHPLADPVRSFVTRRLLYWIEVFSVKGRMSMIPAILRKASSWAKVRHFPDVQGQQLTDFAYAEIWTWSRGCHLKRIQIRQCLRVSYESERATHLSLCITLFTRRFRCSASYA